MILILTVNFSPCSTSEQASSDNARSVGLMAEKFANKGWHFAQKQQRSAGSHPPSGRRAYSTDVRQGGAHISLVTSDVSSFPPHLRELQERIQSFVEEHVLPLEDTFCEHQSSPDRWTPLPVVEDLKV